MPNPTTGPYGTPILDNFNRADGDPGANWVGNFYGAEAKPNITSNRIDAFSRDATCHEDAIT